MDARTEEIRARVETHEMVVALCKRRDEPGKREWIMSIPARPDRDPDLVIGAALRDADRLLTELTALREEVERLRGALEIAFVQGAQWWEWERTSFTMWGADRNRAEAEAAKLNAAGTLGMTYEERMKRLAALSPSPAQQEPESA